MRCTISRAAWRRAPCRRSRPRVASAARCSASSARRLLASAKASKSTRRRSKMPRSSSKSLSRTSTISLTLSYRRRSRSDSSDQPTQASASASSSWRAGWVRRANRCLSSSATLMKGICSRASSACICAGRLRSCRMYSNSMPTRSIVSSSLPATWALSAPCSLPAWESSCSLTCATICAESARLCVLSACPCSTARAESRSVAPSTGPA